jgi:hypothetical protein
MGAAHLDPFDQAIKSGINHEQIMAFELKQRTMLMSFQRSIKLCGNMSLIGICWQLLSPPV